MERRKRRRGGRGRCDLLGGCGLFVAVVVVHAGTFQGSHTHTHTHIQTFTDISLCGLRFPFLSPQTLLFAKLVYQLTFINKIDSTLTEDELSWYVATPTGTTTTAKPTCILHTHCTSLVLRFVLCLFVCLFALPVFLSQCLLVILSCPVIFITTVCAS